MDLKSSAKHTIPIRIMSIPIIMLLFKVLLNLSLFTLLIDELNRATVRLPSLLNIMDAPGSARITPA